VKTTLRPGTSFSPISTSGTVSSVGTPSPARAADLQLLLQIDRSLVQIEQRGAVF